MKHKYVTRTPPSTDKITLVAPFDTLYTHGSVDSEKSMIFLCNGDRIPVIMEYNRYLYSIREKRVLTIEEYNNIILAETITPEAPTKYIMSEGKRYLVMEVGDAVILAHAAQHSIEPQSKHLRAIIRRVYNDIGWDMQSIVDRLKALGEEKNTDTAKGIGSALEAIISNAKTPNE